MFLRNQVFCLKNWKLWQAPTIMEFDNFCWNIAYVFYLPMSTKAKRCSGFFLFCLDLELFAKIIKHLAPTHSQKPDLSITRDLNEINKIPNTLLYTLVSRKRVQNFQLVKVSVRPLQSFQFFRQISYFLGSNRALSRFK